MDLTEDQAAFLAECEKEFGDRYTDKDTEYMKLKSKPLSNPPIVHPWNTGQQRQHYGNHRGGGGRGRGRNHRPYYGERDRPYSDNRHNHHYQQRHQQQSNHYQSSYDNNRDRRSSYDNNRDRRSSYDNNRDHHQQQQRRYDDDRNHRGGSRYQPY